MRDDFKETGKRLWRLAPAGASAVVGLNFDELVSSAQRNWTLFLKEPPPSWLTAEALAPWAQPTLTAVFISSSLWAFWPLLRGAGRWIAKGWRAPTVDKLSQYGATPAHNHADKYVLGGSVEDRPGASIGPMSTADALKVLQEPEPEFIPLDEAARWLYDNAPLWLKEVLQSYAPFDSITAHAAALVGTAADDGAGELRASREPGLKPERARFSDITPRRDPLGKRAKGWSDPMFRKADLPKLLDYYQDPQTPTGPIKVRRDTPLLDALMYVASGQWGVDPMADDAGHLEALGNALIEFRQHAHDGTITVWGKADNHGVWQEIARGYWVNHYVDLLDVLRSETRTKAYNSLTNEPLFKELMVCRAEVEAEWRD